MSNKDMEIIESYNEEIYPLREVLYKEGRKEYAKEKHDEPDVIHCLRTCRSS